MVGMVLIFLPVIEVRAAASGPLGVTVSETQVNQEVS